MNKTVAKDPYVYAFVLTKDTKWGKAGQYPSVGGHHFATRLHLDWPKAIYLNVGPLKALLTRARKRWKQYSMGAGYDIPQDAYKIVAFTVQPSHVIEY